MSDVLPSSLTRRQFLRAGTAVVATATALPTPAAAEPLLRSPLPGGKGSVARVGLGTWQVFDVNSDATKRAALTEVLREFAAAGADVVDTSPMYGSSETVLGDLAAETGLRPKLFFATKVWTPGVEAGGKQMEESLRRLRTDHVELMQVHNLVDWRAHLPALRSWKNSGRARMIGITHYHSGAFDEVARVLRAEPWGFLQLNLSLDEPEAAETLLPLCAERGVGFISNRPFGGGGAFSRTKGKPIPEWAARELGIQSWAQWLLKWVLGHAAVTCAIPGTSDPRHLRDNLGAARGPVPDAKQRERMLREWRAL